MPASYRCAVPLKMRRNFRNRKIASVPVKGPAFSDPKGTSRPKRSVVRQGRTTRRTTHLRGSVPVNVSFAPLYFSQAGQPRGRGGAVCRWHTNKAPTGAAAETRGPPRVFGFFLRVEKETAPPRAVAAK